MESSIRKRVRAELAGTLKGNWYPVREQARVERL